MSPRRRAFLIGVVAIVLIVVAILVTPAILRTFNAPTTADRSRPGTVVLVPGYGGSQDALNVLAARLRADGRTTAIVSLPDNGNGDLIQQAQALDDTVRTALASAPSVDLVGYSAGGVVVRYWLSRFDTASAARRVVTLGAPLHGASIAAVGSAVVPGACPTACQQLAPGSGFLTQLDAAPVPASLTWLSVRTLNDETVEPASSTLDNGRVVNLAVQDICPDETVQHGQLPTDPVVTGLVRRALNQPQPLTVAPGAAECAAIRAEGAR